MSRRISKLPDHVYFVIGGPFTHWDGGTYSSVDGPYSTLGAAKGKRTGFIRYSRDADAAAAQYKIVESPAGEWKQVEL